MLFNFFSIPFLFSAWSSPPHNARATLFPPTLVFFLLALADFFFRSFGLFLAEWINKFSFFSPPGRPDFFFFFREVFPPPLLFPPGVVSLP